MSLDEGLSREDIYPYYTRGLRSIKSETAPYVDQIVVLPVEAYDLIKGTYVIKDDELQKFSPYHLEAVRVLLSLRTSRQTTELNVTMNWRTGSIACFSLRKIR